MEAKLSCSCNKKLCTCSSTNCNCGNSACSCCINETLVTISAEDLKDNIEHAINFTVVNVLSQELFEDCHIKGSINAPLAQLKLIAKDWDRNRNIVVYCASHECPASKKAYAILRTMGFRRVTAYEGGIKEWKQKGFKCVGLCKRDYLKA